MSAKNNYVENLQKSVEKLEEFDMQLDVLGDVLWDNLNDEDNSPYDMAAGLADVFSGCTTTAELVACDKLLAALTGYSLSTQIEEYMERVEKQETIER